ncbi:MAG: ABC transporter permease [Cyclobacteriaceae bacterium]|nr:ABC transporter permease [Cyclobacteriaceae bacterium]
MKRFYAFVKKEFYHILRDYRTMLILFGMPVAQIMLFGFAITNEIKDAHIAILDPSKDHETSRLNEKILSSGYFILDKYLNSPGEIESVFEEGKVKIVVVYDEDFGRKLLKNKAASIQIIADATDPNTANTLTNYISAIFQDYVQSQNPLAISPVRVIPEVRFRYNPDLKGVFLFIPGLITIILMLVSAMMTSISLTREKELGTMEVLLASPMKPVQIIVAKVIPYIILAFIISIVILLLGYLVFKVPVKGNIALLISEFLLFIITALSLGILISTIAKTQQVALMMSLMGLMLPTIILSGFIFPVENMPKILQWISYLIPAKWFITIVKGIMLKGLGIEAIWKETLIILGFTLFFLIVSIKKFKIRLA